MLTCCQCGLIAPEAKLIQLPKNEVTLRNWIQQYNLNLVEKRDGQFICKSHLSADKAKQKSSTHVAYDEPSTSDNYFHDIKQEMEEETKYMDSWIEPKTEQDEEVNYEDFPFEMEDNSYGAYDEEMYNYEQNGYEMNCQPTTSTGTYGIAQPSTVEPSDLSNLRFCYPELSDEQIMSFCVRTSSNLSGESSFECGMCTEQYFENTDTRPIRLHLEMAHSMLINNYIQTGTAHLAPKLFAPVSPKTKAAADESLCKFLVKNGLPLRAVKDQNLEMLTFNMNSSYKLPSIDKLTECLQEIALNRRNMKIHVENESITVTFDTTSFETRNYLAFTIHYYHNGSKKKQLIFLQEFKKTQSPVSSIISIIKNAMSGCNIRLPITTIVTGNEEYEETLENLECSDQVLPSFSEVLKKFADSLISEVFDKPLKKLRNFITKFPSNRSDWTRFKAYIVRKRTYGEYPEVDDDNWFTTVDFITKCLHMHRLFSEFPRLTNTVEYIDVEDNINIVYLHSLLNLCKNSLRLVVESRASIADVIPAIAEIGASLHVSTTEESVVFAVHSLYKRILRPVVEQSDIHRFAAFLHPRRHGTDILSNTEWISVRTSLTRHLALRMTNKSSSLNKAGKTNRLPQPNNTACDREVAEFCAYVGRVAQVESEVVDWWARHSSRFPLLYSLAKEIYLTPALSIDASFYLGDFGILTYSLNETEEENRKTLLEASSDLVDFRAKGEIMSRPICVKRKRDTACAEDMWYTPVDMKAIQIPGSANGMGSAKRGTLYNRPPQTLSTAALSSNRIYLSKQCEPPRVSYPAPSVPRKSLKEAIAHMSRPIKNYNRTYKPPSQYPYAKPIIVNKPSNLLPVKNEIEDVKVPLTTKKYYAVKTIPSNGKRLIRTMDGRIIQVVTKPRLPVTINQTVNATVNTQQKRKYILFDRKME
uniref:Dimer_Tnp_hAT domain-containing protein n=2 Tax=Caenorhabditis tropicalis TaxID=1561998 RepID=A0A1I7TFH2_9PELO